MIDHRSETVLESNARHSAPRCPDWVIDLDQATVLASETGRLNGLETDPVSATVRIGLGLAIGPDVPATDPELAIDLGVPGIGRASMTVATG